MMEEISVGMSSCYRRRTFDFFTPDGSLDCDGYSIALNCGLLMLKILWGLLIFLCYHFSMLCGSLHVLCGWSIVFDVVLFFFDCSRG